MATLEFTTEDGVNGVYDRLIDAEVRILHGEANRTGEVRLVPTMQFVVRVPFETGNLMARWALAPIGKGRFAKVKLTLADRGVDETHVWELKRAYIHRLEETEFPETAHNETTQENTMRVVIRGVVASGEDYDGSSVLTMTSAIAGATSPEPTPENVVSSPSVAAANAGGTPSGWDASEMSRATGTASSGKWSVAGVLKTLCPDDKKVVDQLAKTKVTVADAIYFDDPYYDGSKWTTKRFDAGGTSNSAAKEIGIMSGTTDADAATTFYHEIWHQNQKPGMTFEQKEYDAYSNTEKWTIAKGLPSQAASGVLRTLDAKGNVIVNQAGVEKYVHDNYPVPPKVSGIPPPRPVDRDAAGNTILSDGTSRPPIKGDTYPGPRQAVNEKVLPSNVWKCP